MMRSFRSLSLSVFLLIGLTTTYAAIVEILNDCPYTVWAAAVPGGGRRLDRGQIWTISFVSGTVQGARIWARTGCSFDRAGRGRCETGDCDGLLECQGFGTPPQTLAELALNSTNYDFYDISLVDGFNVPMEFSPFIGHCSGTIRCTADINGQCPNELRAPGGCNNPCTVFKTDQYCCNSGSACRPTNYSRFFKDRCPDAYSYPFDDPSTFICPTGAYYRVIFCSPVEPQGMAPVVSPGFPPESNSPINGGMSNALSPAPSSESNSPGYYPPTGYDGSERKGPSSPMGLILGLILGIIAIIIITIVIMYLLKRQWSPSGTNKESNQNIEKFLLQHGSLIQKRYKYFEIRKIAKSFNDKLGQGGYGSVYKGMLPDGSLVAVKLLAETNSNGEEFINEVASISKTSHVNIVNLVGFCFDGKKRALIYEFMPNKSLDKFISNNGSSNVDCQLDLEKLFKIAVGVAKGLEYLHTGCNTRIVHFDIKPQNILLDEDFCPKISDFGLAKLCKKKQSVLSMLGTRGTIGYIAPEVFSRNFGGVSHKSDVYSYGMMVLEMIGARKIEETEPVQSSGNYFPDKIYAQVILDIVGGSSPDDFMIEEEQETRSKMFLVGFWCIQTNPSDRPPMSKVVEMLEGSVQSIQIPPKPTLFCPNTLSGQETSPSLSEYLEKDNTSAS